MRVRSLIRSLLLCVLASVAWGCSSAPREPFAEFEPGPAIASAPGVQRLVIDLGAEVRPEGGRNRIGAGFLAFIPLWPYGPQEWRRIYNRSDLRDELAATIARDMLASGMTRDAFTGTLAMARTLPGSIEPHVLRVTVHEAVWNRNCTAYGLSLLGPILWMLSAPVSYGSGQVDFTAELVGPDGAALASERFVAVRGITEWPYSRGAVSGPFSEMYAGISPGLRALVSRGLARAPAP
jgi:hypothetical protein